MQGLDLLDDYRGNLPGPAQLDTTVLQHLQGGPGPFRYQRALVAGNGTKHTEEDIGHHTGTGIDTIGYRNQPGAAQLDPLDDGQQVQGAPAKAVDPICVDDITGLKLIQ